MTDVQAERWVESRWAEEDVTFYFEFGPEGQVLRQIELVGPTKRARGAAELREIVHALRRGGPAEVVAYEERFGGLADQPDTGWGDYPRTPISEGQFEEVWRRARTALEQRPGPSCS